MFVFVFMSFLVFALILKRKGELAALLELSYGCLVSVKCSMTLPHGCRG